jgi:hypothetical protein
MLRASEIRNQEARRKAQEQLAKIKQRDAAALQEARKAQRAEDDKTARLRVLRLAREAADKEAAADKAVQAAKPKAMPRKRRADASPATASNAGTQ